MPEQVNSVAAEGHQNPLVIVQKEVKGEKLRKFVTRMMRH